MLIPQQDPISFVRLFRVAYRSAKEAYSQLLPSERRLTVINETIALDQPSESNSGRYWYNLHVVLVVADRARFRIECDFANLDLALIATATKHQCQLAVRAWMPDHLHIALRGNIAESPAEIALAFMNNTLRQFQQRIEVRTVVSGGSSTGSYFSRQLPNRYPYLL